MAALHMGCFGPRPDPRGEGYVLRETTMMPASPLFRAGERRLAVVRCGDDSLHRTWAEGHHAFDVGVSYFGNDPHKAFPEARYVHRAKGGKWDGLLGFFQQFPEVIDRYDYFWLPDDDISAHPGDIDRLFSIGAAHQCQVFQPALNEHSYYSHLVTLLHPSFVVRYTNFVEVMVPVVSREILIRTIPLLEDTRSGFGIDFVWPLMAEEISGASFKGIAIVDSVSVCHTRPVGGSLHQFMSRSEGASAMDEMREMLSRVTGKRGAVINGVAVPRIRIISGIDVHGRHLKGVRLAISIGTDLIRRHTNRVQPVHPFAALKHAVKAGA